MSNPWDPQYAVDEALARRLLDDQFPQIAAAELVRLGRGWDNDMWRTGPLAWRFPRRDLGTHLLETEARVLPALAPLLPLPIPAPCYFGQPAPGYPSPFLGYHFLDGTTADRARLDDDQRARLAAPLGRFLRQLHAFDPDRALEMGAPPDTIRGDMPRTSRLILERAALLEQTPWADRIPGIRAAVEAAPDSDTAGLRCLLHGDLYARHLLLDEDRALCGVIDWGDVCVGDPCKDLSVAFTLLPEAARPGFWAAYGDPGPETLRRARHCALMYGTVLVLYAADVSDAPLLAEGERALDNALSG